jgi:hypothetical protein
MMMMIIIIIKSVSWTYCMHCSCFIQIYMFHKAWWQHDRKIIHAMWVLMVKELEISVSALNSQKRSCHWSKSKSVWSFKDKNIQVKQDNRLFFEVNTLLILCKNYNRLRV